MADYTIKNLKEIEDSAVKFGYSPDLESRFARGALETAQVGLSYQRLAPNVRAPFGHTHKEQEEIYVVVGGSGRVKLGDDVQEVKQWDAVRVAPETARCFEAGPDGIELLAFGSGAGGVQDAEPLPAWWTD
jgi:mannose-6-phosphate isomerase-like protein (cupin superfamily)